MSQVLFVVSDIHGHYTALTKALADAGFDDKNETHVLVSVGDLFDRGKENLEVYRFVKGLKRKILIKGNHEDMLCETLLNGALSQHDRDNGANITVTQMLGQEALRPDGSFDTAENWEKIQEVLDFVDSMVDYYETECYVFTHGWLPVVFDGYHPSVDEDWRHATEEEWKFAHELEWQQFYSVGAVLKGKTIICGHRPAYLGHMFDNCREPDCSDPFYGNGLIAIDANTVRSGRVNVLVIQTQ